MAKTNQKRQQCIIILDSSDEDSADSDNEGKDARVRKKHDGKTFLSISSSTKGTSSSHSSSPSSLSLSVVDGVKNESGLHKQMSDCDSKSASKIGKMSSLRRDSGSPRSNSPNLSLITTKETAAVDIAAQTDEVVLSPQEKNEELLVKFQDECKKHLTSSDDKKFLEFIKNRHATAKSEYLGSKDYRNLLTNLSEKISNDPHNIYVYIRDLVHELKANRRVPEKTTTKRKNSCDSDASQPPAAAAAAKKFRCSSTDTDFSLDLNQRIETKTPRRLQLRLVRVDRVKSLNVSASSSRDSSPESRNIPLVSRCAAAETETESRAHDAERNGIDDINTSNECLKNDDDKNVSENEIQPSLNSPINVRSFSPDHCVTKTVDCHPEPRAGTSKTLMDGETLTEPIQVETEDDNESQPENTGNDENIEASSASNSKKKGSRRQIEKLETLLEAIHKKIKKLQEKELSLDDLDKEDNSHILEHKLAQRFTKCWTKLCEIKGRDIHVGRISDRKFKFNGTRFREINKLLARFINNTKSFPDYHDVKRVISKSNKKYNLGLNASKIQALAREAFTDIGDRLQKRRQQDFVSDFGCELTDQVRTEADPAIYNLELRRQLDQNKKAGKMKLDDVINKFARKQYEDDDDENDDDDEDEEDTAGEEELPDAELETVLNDIDEDKPVESTPAGREEVDGTFNASVTDAGKWTNILSDFARKTGDRMAADERVGHSENHAIETPDQSSESIVHHRSSVEDIFTDDVTGTSELEHDDSVCIIEYHGPSPRESRKSKTSVVKTENLGISSNAETTNEVDVILLSGSQENKEMIVNDELVDSQPKADAQTYVDDKIVDLTQSELSQARSPETTADKTPSTNTADVGQPEGSCQITETLSNCERPVKNDDCVILAQCSPKKRRLTSNDDCIVVKTSAATRLKRLKRNHASSIDVISASSLDDRVILIDAPSASKSPPPSASPLTIIDVDNSQRTDIGPSRKKIRCQNIDCPVEMRRLSVEVCDNTPSKPTSNDMAIIDRLLSNRNSNSRETVNKSLKDNSRTPHSICNIPEKTVSAGDTLKTSSISIRDTDDSRCVPEIQINSDSSQSRSRNTAENVQSSTNNTRIIPEIQISDDENDDDDDDDEVKEVSKSENQGNIVAKEIKRSPQSQPVTVSKGSVSTSTSMLQIPTNTSHTSAVRVNENLSSFSPSISPNMLEIRDQQRPVISESPSSSRSVTPVTALLRKTGYSYCRNTRSVSPVNRSPAPRLVAESVEPSPLGGNLMLNVSEEFRAHARDVMSSINTSPIKIQSYKSLSTNQQIFNPPDPDEIIDISD
ncbi:uncharacterized protein LOC141908160 [Tubulanus polymorphus]|uniref:uncharacterized protein LOC141908160 n=1 Tax=Tubulanus polymorphus TaxID=672921 RepID=UPI003DA35EC7